VSSIRRQLGWTDKSSVQKPKAKPSNISPSVASEAVEKLSKDIFTSEVNLKNGKIFLLGFFIGVIFQIYNFQSLLLISVWPNQPVNQKL
jgi:hypothetical protein